ncbi:MAG: PAS domain-containing protein [Acidobacteriota bacterium]|nr:PAS domain-containing protein [Acidobacteriota bacterium]
MSKQDNLAREIEKVRRERDAYARALNDSNEAFIRKVKEFSIIKRIAASINGTLEPRKICGGLVDLIIDETEAENCSLWLLDKSGGWLQLAAVKGQENEEARYWPIEERGGNRIEVGKGVAGRVAQTGETLRIEDVTTNRWFNNPDIGPSIRSLLCLPIKAENKLVGVLNMSHPDPDAFTQEQELVLQLITEQVGVAFTNMSLFQEIRQLNQDLERKVTERTEHLVRSEDRYERAVNAGQVGIWDWRLGSENVYVAPNLAAMLGYTPETTPKKLRAWFRMLNPEDRRAILHGIRRCIQTGKDVYEGEVRMRHLDGSTRWFFVRGAVARDEDGVPQRVAGSHTDITRRKGAELELSNLQKEALVHAHAAGKAEFATTVLHNIGNVLNSVNVDSLEIRRSARAMRLDRLVLAFDMLRENKDNLSDFFASDKGNRLETYLLKVADVMSKEANNLINHTEEIQNKIEIARDIIETQQNYAKGNELKKQDLIQLVDEALKIQHESIRKRGILLKKKYAAVKPIQLPSAKVIHVLINLVKNAVEAMVAVPENKRVLSVELGQTGRDGVFIRIEDSGEGIAAENLDKMFSHGFTTKKHGHGFGLRYCAKTARELGGDITVCSDGTGKGASFTLRLPYDRNENQGEEPSEAQTGEVQITS